MSLGCGEDLDLRAFPSDTPCNEAARHDSIYGKMCQEGVFFQATKIAVHPYELLKMMFFGLNGERGWVLRAADVRPESAQVDLEFYSAQWYGACLDCRLFSAVNL